MDGLCLKAGIIGLTTPITVTGEIRTNPSHITASAVSRTTASAISSEKPSRSGSPARPWGFSLTYPIRSLFAGNRNRYDAVAVDDTVSVDRKEEKKEESEKNGQNTNWVLKILHVRSLWKEGEDYRIEEADEEVNDRLENEIDHDNEASADKECDACRVDDGDGDADKSNSIKFRSQNCLGGCLWLKQCCMLKCLIWGA